MCEREEDRECEIEINNENPGNGQQPVKHFHWIFPISSGITIKYGLVKVGIASIYLSTSYYYYHSFFISIIVIYLFLFYSYSFFSFLFLSFLFNYFILIPSLLSPRFSPIYLLLSRHFILLIIQLSPYPLHSVLPVFASRSMSLILTSAAALYLLHFVSACEIPVTAIKW